MRAEYGIVNDSVFINDIRKKFVIGKRKYPLAEWDYVKDISK